MKLVLASSLGFALAVSAWGQHVPTTGDAGGGVGRVGGGFSSGRSFSVQTPSSSGAGLSRSFGTTPAYRPGSLAQPNHYQIPQQNRYEYNSPIGPPPFGGTQPPVQRGEHGNRGRGDGYRPYYSSYSSGIYLVPGYLSSGFYGSGYTEGYSDPQQGAYPESDPRVAESGSYAPPYQGEMQQPYPAQAAPPARPPYEPETSASSPVLQDQPQLTLLFKDGRPPQRVQNYAVTRSTLYVLDGARRREIPLDQLDVPLTEKTNREAGMEFDVPATAD